MKIDLSYKNETAHIEIEGAVTSENISLFEEKLTEILDTESKFLELDLSLCRNISSSGIGKLLIFYKEFLKRNGEMEVVKSSETLYDLFTTIKLDQLFTVNL
ncbi:MAG: hypothetical protein CSB55_07625 [Candidatus Cloacimonadota bacterium]|nr:MAG: hypothetical protein CSB55_07625 [Candidatus Cloacimonadota bacterium]